ncbi:MAG: lysoplasmalogenase [Anaerolineales bacterium]|nr:lysoplasmalogenase [Anaerolineales bacterium]
MLLNTLPLLALVFAVLDWYAVLRLPERRKLEMVAKPLATGLLLAWLVLQTGLQGSTLWFGLGLALCILGDVLLLWIDRFFVFGLVAFLLGHVFYVIGFNIPLPEVSPAWSFGLAILLAITTARVMRPIMAGLAAKGLHRLQAPVLLYALVITVMLLSAMLALWRPDWTASAAGLVALGAALFFLSDILLAWFRFVQPIKNGRVFQLAMYHLGQIALMSGVVIQFTGS